MDKGSKNRAEVPKLDDALNIEVNGSPIDQLEKTQIDVFFSRLLGARQDVDRIFRNQFGLTAYPYLEILLMVRAPIDDLGVRDIGESLFFTPTLTHRYLEILVSKGLLERAGTEFHPNETGEALLTDVVRNHLSYSFKLVD